MSQHLIVVHLEAGCATLRSRDGHSFQVPAAWLPAEVQEGSAVIADIDRGEHSSRLAVRVVEGTTEPEGTDIGA
ncbi:MAG: hypothetical protein WD314_12835 [Trueperaceae bacterium]